MSLFQSSRETFFVKQQKGLILRVTIFASIFALVSTWLIYLLGGTAELNPGLLLISILIISIYLGAIPGLISAVVFGLFVGPLMPLSNGVSQTTEDWFLRIVVWAIVAFITGVVVSNIRLQLETSIRRTKQVVEEWQATFDSITDGIAIIDKNRQLIKANASFYHQFQIPPGVLSGEPCYNLVHNLDKPHDKCPFDQTLKDKTSCTSTLYDDRLGVWLECTTSPVFDTNGELIEVVHTYKDVTARKQAEETLRESEEKYRQLAEKTESIPWEYDVHKDQWAYIAPQVERITGYRPEEWTNLKFWTDHIHKQDREQASLYCADCAKKGLAHTFEYRFVKKNGDIIWLRDIVSVEMKDDQPMKLRGVMFDITENKQLEENLRNAAEEWRTTFDSITDPISILDTKGRLMRVNQAFARAFGEKPKNLIGRYCYEVAHGTDEPISDCPLRKTIENKEPVSVEINDIGKGRFSQVTTYPVVDDKGEVTSIIHIAKDITELKEAEKNEQQLRDKAEMSSRLAAVGEMAAGIAHEINNPLTGVIGFSEMLLGREDIPEDMKEELTIINDGSQRVKDIVRRMLTFARQSQPVRSATSITELLENTLELRSYVLKTSNIQVVKDYDPELPWVTADSGQLQQVFLNIIVNAEYAMKKAHDKGVLKVKTEQLDGHIRVSITDDGPGMTEEIKDKLFQPFFTTKEPGEGTGLGLPLSFGIVQEHGGSIEVDSEEGKGTTFMINLPITPVEELEEIQELIAEEPERKTKERARILVADDEPTVGALVKAVLIAKGHEVTDCRTPDEAFEKLGASSYDLAILDIRMPGMSGIELYEEIKKRWPEQAGKVMFLTGDTSDLVTREYLNTHQVPYMVKPFERQELIDKVQFLLS